MADRIFVFSIVVIKKITIKILIRELRFKIHYSNKYDIIIFYIKDILFDNTRAFVEIT